MGGGETAVALIGETLKPTAPVDQELFGEVDCGVGRGGVRRPQKGDAGARRYGELTERALRRALADKPSLELASRVQSLLEDIDYFTLTPDRLQTYRGIEVLERISSTRQGRPPKLRRRRPRRPAHSGSQTGAGAIEVGRSELELRQCLPGAGLHSFSPSGESIKPHNRPMQPVRTPVKLPLGRRRRRWCAKRGFGGVRRPAPAQGSGDPRPAHGPKILRGGSAQCAARCARVS